jgi:hypothetical protein
MQVVSGGGTASSTSYRMTFTVGDPTVGATSASTNYRQQAGPGAAQGSTP